MSNEAHSTLFPVDHRTWASILVTGAGFGLVAAVALIVADYSLQGWSTLIIPAVFGYTAGHLNVGSSAFGVRPAMIGNAAVLFAALGVALHQVIRALDDYANDAPAALVLFIVMSAFLHLAVVIVCGESLMRLARGIRHSDTGARPWQCT